MRAYVNENCPAGKYDNYRLTAAIDIYRRALLYATVWENKRQSGQEKRYLVILNIVYIILPAIPPWRDASVDWGGRLSISWFRCIDLKRSRKKNGDLSLVTKSLSKLRVSLTIIFQSKSHTLDTRRIRWTKCLFFIKLTSTTQQSFIISQGRSVHLV